MTSESKEPGLSSELFDDAHWYDRSINWSARLERELPVLLDTFGPPSVGGIIDAGCGTGRHVHALAQHGYRVVGIDQCEEMLQIASSRYAPHEKVRLLRADYANLRTAVGTGFDGLLCLGNSLAAAGSRGAAQDALHQFAECLRPGGRLLMQVLNFGSMLDERPCVRGPRVSVVEGQEYVSVREFYFEGARALVTNITCWYDGGWRHRSRQGVLYPVSGAELQEWLAASRFRINAQWGNYAREPFDPHTSSDLIVLATRA